MPRPTTPVSLRRCTAPQGESSRPPEAPTNCAPVTCSFSFGASATQAPPRNRTIWPARALRHSNRGHRQTALCPSTHRRPPRVMQPATRLIRHPARLLHPNGSRLLDRLGVPAQDTELYAPRSTHSTRRTLSEHGPGGLPERRTPRLLGSRVKDAGYSSVGQSGVEVALVNDGPMTLVLDVE